MEALPLSLVEYSPLAPTLKNGYLNQLEFEMFPVPYAFDFWKV